MIIDIVLYRVEGRGGVEDVVTKVSKGLKRLGHCVRLFLQGKPKYEEWLDTLEEVILYGNETTTNVIDLYLEYHKCIWQYGFPDVVIACQHTLMGFVCKNAVLSLPEKKIKVVSWLHGIPECYGSEYALNYCDGHIAISSYIKNKIDETIKGKEEIILVGNPIPNKEFHLKKQCRDKLKLLYVGRLAKEKNIDFMLQALAMVTSPWEFNIIGDGEEKDNLVSLANTLNINSNIIWHGWQENAFDMVEDVTAFLMASSIEGFSVSMASALMQGIPVITTPVSGVTDMIVPNENGWIYNHGDKETLVRILENIYNHNVEIPSPESCRKYVMAFEEKKVVNRIERALLHFMEK